MTVRHRSNMNMRQVLNLRPLIQRKKFCVDRGLTQITQYQNSKVEGKHVAGYFMFDLYLLLLHLLLLYIYICLWVLVRYFERGFVGQILPRHFQKPDKI